ncbi:MAG TPA: sensor histidine kinase, partial [Pseudogracilibacillus sp.]|nr:sensor histidine kinase [Pseudogracilibacillus sp.]
MKLKAKINLYSAVTFIILLIIIQTFIYFTFKEMIYQKELDRSHQSAVKIVTDIKDVNQKVAKNDLLRAYLPLHGMIRVVEEDGEMEGSITAPTQQALKDYPVKTYEQEKVELVNRDGSYYAFVSIPIILENGAIANLQMMENLDDLTKVLDILKLILVLASIFAM